MLGLQSILKNYREHEQITRELSHSLNNMAMINNLAKFQVEGARVDQDFTSYLADLHVDYDDYEGTTDPVLYDIAVSNILELRNKKGPHEIRFNSTMISMIIEEAMTFVTDQCCLTCLENFYDQDLKKKVVSPNSSFYNWLRFTCQNQAQQEKVHKLLENAITEFTISEKIEVWEDFTFINEFVRGQEVDIEDGGPTRTYKYVIVTYVICLLSLTSHCLYLSIWQFIRYCFN